MYFSLSHFHKKAKRHIHPIIKYFSPYKDWKFVILVFLSYAFLFLSYKISNVAGKIATRFAGPEISDTLFDVLPKIDTSSIHGSLSFFLFDIRNFIFLLFPSRIVFSLFTLGTLVLTRAVFINMTHLGIPDGAHPILSMATFGGDLFFSGHVANTFLIALLFWDIKVLRFFFLGCSVLFGASAILGRYHYTIDVLSAPFIAYGVFILCTKFFAYLKK